MTSGRQQMNLLFRQKLNVRQPYSSQYIINYNKPLNKKNEIISLIAEMVGYCEQANFSRQFRQITSYAPTLWRQNQECL